MKESEKLPVGIGEEFQKERRKETLPAIEVDNVVVWVNPAFEETAPLKSLAEGQPTDLAVFFSKPDFVRRKIHELFSGRVHKLQIMPELGATRSGLFGSVLFQDSEGNLYRDLDIKGVGFVGRDMGLKIQVVRPKEDTGEAFGLMNYGHARRDRDYSEKFIKAGIRTHRVVSIIQLKEIATPEGEKISVSEAKDKGMIPQEMQPVAVIRAFGTKERIDYLQGHVARSRREKALQDAMALISQELSLDPQDFPPEEYIAWFAKTLGMQVGKMRKMGIHHSYLTAHNITLDCRIVDLDSVLPIEEALKIRGGGEDRLYEKELAFAKNSLWILYSNMEFILGARRISVPFLNIRDIFQKAYQDELTSKA